MLAKALLTLPLPFAVLECKLKPLCWTTTGLPKIPCSFSLALYTMFLFLLLFISGSLVNIKEQAAIHFSRLAFDIAREKAGKRPCMTGTLKQLDNDLGSNMKRFCNDER